MADNKEKLFSDFTAPSAQEWREKIEVDLKGADYQKKMVWRTNEGFSMDPFYRKEDVENLATVNALPGQYPYVRGNKAADNSWYVRQDIKCGECAKEANAKALDNRQCSAFNDVRGVGKALAIISGVCILIYFFFFPKSSSFIYRLAMAASWRPILASLMVTIYSSSSPSFSAI